MPIPDYEVKIVLKSDLNKDDLSFIKNKIDKISNELGMFVHNDGVTYSKKEPYKKYSDIPTGTKFYFRLKKFEKYFALLEYYSYAEGDINGRLIRCGNCPRLKKGNVNSIRG